jgi:hypothetical protein
VQAAPSRKSSPYQVPGPPFPLKIKSLRLSGPVWAAGGRFWRPNAWHFGYDRLQFSFILFAFAFILWLWSFIGSHVTAKTSLSGGLLVILTMPIGFTACHRGLPRPTFRSRCAIFSLPWEPFLYIWGSFWDPLVSFWDPVGPFTDVRACFGVPWETFWILGFIWGSQGPVYGRVRSILGSQGNILGPLQGRVGLPVTKKGTRSISSDGHIGDLSELIGLAPFFFGSSQFSGALGRVVYIAISHRSVYPFISMTQKLWNLTTRH